MTRDSPVDRVRARVAAAAGLRTAARLPDGYQRLGSVLVVKLPDELRPWFRAVGDAYVAELGVRTVLQRRGPITGAWRLPELEPIAGTATETEVRENGVRYRFDAARIMFASGNRVERARIGRIVRPGETVVDLFAGIGYFTIPAARTGRAARVYACEENPTSFRYLEQNLGLNGVTDRVLPLLGDCRDSPVPLRSADRVLLGLLPTALPFVPRAVSLLRAEGGWVHVHLVVGSRAGTTEAAARVRESIGALGEVAAMSARAVKPYGPGRLHAVVDAQVRPAS